MLELNKTYNMNCIEGMKLLEDNCIDLTVTSPPYDDLRSYKGCEWNFDIFKQIANELYRVTKEGGVVVWIVGDKTIKGSESGTSFKQALYFKDIGFNLHDTMIYEKNSSSFPASRNSNRYTQIFEYMFILSKGKLKTHNLICDKENKWAGFTNWGKNTQYTKDGIIETKKIKPVPKYSPRTNIWKYVVGFNDKTGHPAVFPEKLAEDNIKSWSNEGDLVMDIFSGSGTTHKMCLLNNRQYIGFELAQEYIDMENKRLEYNKLI